MDKQFPLFPELSPEGEQEAQDLIDKFKIKLIQIANETIGELYCDVATYIQTDSWTNFRNELLSGFQDYGNRKVQSEYDFKKIRSQIYSDFREELIVDLNQDLVKEVKTLKEDLKREREFNQRKY